MDIEKYLSNLEPESVTEPIVIGKPVTIERVGFYGTDKAYSDDASEVWVVFRVTDSEENITHWKRTGYYSSYDGVEWHTTLRNVTGRERTITVWD